jgi:hypothetical protein
MLLDAVAVCMLLMHHLLLDVQLSGAGSGSCGQARCWVMASMMN